MADKETDKLETAPYSVVQLSPRRWIIIYASGRGRSGSPMPDYWTASFRPVDVDGNVTYFGDGATMPVETFNALRAAVHMCGSFNERWDRYRKANTKAMIAEDERAGVGTAEMFG